MNHLNNTILESTNTPTQIVIVLVYVVPKNVLHDVHCSGTARLLYFVLQPGQHL